MTAESYLYSRGCKFIFASMGASDQHSEEDATRERAREEGTRIAAEGAAEDLRERHKLQRAVKNNPPINYFAVYFIFLNLCTIKLAFVQDRHASMSLDRENNSNVAQVNLSLVSLFFKALLEIGGRDSFLKCPPTILPIIKQK